MALLPLMQATAELVSAAAVCYLCPVLLAAIVPCLALSLLARKLMMTSPPPFFCRRDDDGSSSAGGGGGSAASARHAAAAARAGVDTLSAALSRPGALFSSAASTTFCCFVQFTHVISYRPAGQKLMIKESDRTSCTRSKVQFVLLLSYPRRPPHSSVRPPPPPPHQRILL